MRVALLFDGGSALDSAPDVLIIQTVEAIETALMNEGNTVVRVPVSAEGKWIDRIRRGRFDVAFNMCEGIDGVAEMEPPVISVLELFGLAYTGSSSYTTALCLRKHVVNSLLSQSGLPVPPWITLRRGSRIRSVGYPAIVKPAAEDASIGVEQRSVVRSSRALKARVEAMLQTFDDVIVQRYIAGRELNVGIVGDTILPIAEIDFSAMPKGLWRMVTYRSKWETGSDEDLGAQPRCPADLPGRSANEVRRIALEAWRMVGGHGYGRVDMRLDENGQPWILEVNSNPDIAPDAGLARMARKAGVEYSTLVRTITELGLSRKRDQQPQYAQWVLAQQLSGIQVPAGAAPELDLFAGGMVTPTINIGPLELRHRGKVEEIVRATGVFNEGEVSVALEVFDEGLRHGVRDVGSDATPQTTDPAPDPYELIGAFSGDDLVGYACYGATPSTDRTYDLYWIAVHPQAQHAGAGAALMSEVEQRLEARSARVVVVETSSRDDYAPTRRFYHRLGYIEAARLRDFYAPGDDRVVLSKRLGSGDPGGNVAARPLSS